MDDRILVGIPKVRTQFDYGASRDEPTVDVLIFETSTGGTAPSMAGLVEAAATTQTALSTGLSLAGMVNGAGSQGAAITVAHPLAGVVEAAAAATVAAT